MRVLLAAFFILLLAVPAGAGDEPAIDELARMVLHGTDAEQALVAKWLENADREQLLALFQAVRTARHGTSSEPGSEPGSGPGAEPRPEPVKPTKGLVNLEVKFIDVRVEDAARLLGPDRPSPDTTSRLMDAADVDRLMRNVEASEGAVLVSAPRVTAYDGQRANMQVINQISFIQDFDVETGNPPVVDPIIGIMQEGVTLELRGKITADRKAIDIEFLGTWAVLQRPIKEKKIKLAGKEHTIQLPELDVAKTEAAIRLNDGGYAMLGGGVEFEIEGHRVERVALLRAQILELDRKPDRVAEIEPGLAQPMLEMHTEVILVPEDRIRSYLGDRTLSPARVHVLDAHQAAKLIMEARSDDALEVITASKLATLDGRKADLQLLNEVSYVKEFKKIEKGGRTIFDPVVAKLQDGVVIEITPTLSANKEMAVIEFSGAFAAIERPIRRVTKTVAGVQLVTQHPEMSVTRSKATIQMRSDTYVLVRGGKPGKFAKGEHVTIIHLKIGTVGEFVGAKPPGVRKNK